jgi:hypothetical protein
MVLMLLAEELLLLATNEALLSTSANSNFASPSLKSTAAIPRQVRHALSYVLPAALMSEMALMGQIRLNDDGKVIAASRTPEHGSPTHDIWNDLQRSWGKFTPQTWYRVFASMPGGRIKHLSRRLSERGLIREEQKRFLGIFPYRIYLLQDESTPRRLKEKMLHALRTGVIKSDPRLIVTARLCAACGLLALWLSKEELERTLLMLDELTSINVWTNELQREQLLLNSSGDGSESAMLAVILSSAASGGSDGTWTSEGGSYYNSEAGTNGDGSSSDSTSSSGADGGGGDGGGGD